MGFARTVALQDSVGFLQNLVVVAIRKDDEYFGGILSDTSSAGGGQHVGTVDDSRTDGSSRTAAGSTRNAATEDDALSVGGALKGRGSVDNLSFVSTQRVPDLRYPRCFLVSR